MNKLKTVLLVDDDEATNFINRLLIQKFEITEELVTVRNGKEAIDFLKKCTAESENGTRSLPELILLDINMPVMDGFSFLENYKQTELPNKENVVIAVLTTSLNPKDMEKVKAAGISDFISKPLTKSSLQSLMEKHYAS